MESFADCFERALASTAVAVTLSFVAVVLASAFPSQTWRFARWHASQTLGVAVDNYEMRKISKNVAKAIKLSYLSNFAFVA